MIDKEMMYRQRITELEHRVDSLKAESDMFCGPYRKQVRRAEELLMLVTNLESCLEKLLQIQRNPSSRTETAIQTADRALRYSRHWRKEDTFNG